MFGSPSHHGIERLVQATWQGDANAREVLADACDEMGRYDCGMLFRGQLPSYRRRQRVDRLNEAEKAQIKTNIDAWRDNVMYRTGPSDALLAAAAIYGLYEAAAIENSKYPTLPKVTWLPSPAAAAKHINDIVDTNTQKLIWYQYSNYRHSTQSTAVHRYVTDLQYQWIPDLTTILQRAGEADGIALVHGVSAAQFSQQVAITAATIDIMRIGLGNNNERSLRAVIALAQVTPYWIAWDREIILSAHPTLFDQDGAPATYGTVPRWAWIDDNNQPHQWPATL